MCSSDRAREYVRTWDRSHGQPGEFTFVKCSGCGHVYLNPRPTQAEIGRYYPETYKEYVMGVEEEPSAFVRLNRRYGLAKRCRVITSRRPPGRFLDVGCGTGILMEAMRRRGWQVQGVDFTPAAVRAARQRGLDVVEGTLEGAGFADDSFDAVALWNVIEHVPDPSASTLEVARVLKPGGLVVMATPNVDALDARLFGRYWALWEAPRHFNVFSPATLGRVLEASGFTKVAHESVVGTWFGLVTSLQYMWEDRQGVRPSPGDGTRPYWDTQLPMQALRALALPYTWLADRLGAGSTMVVSAERAAVPTAGSPPAFLSRQTL